ncbi:hypothetical protein PHMEG_00016343 [Phytophthora megakarya]|uniref:Uncharacterized protein n=1 Tax=Phytophthora megakarya TaxID=4795 RepID=A0A225W162_9STRA|nr:hypothetical protein PHMEG_00016343 [Phytophthora megakarya]
MLGGLKSYKGANGHLLIPQALTVPFGDASYPQGLRGYRLEAGFCYIVHERDWTEKILPSLQTYHQKFGHCIVKHDFEVPNAHPWPEKAG